MGNSGNKIIIPLALFSLFCFFGLGFLVHHQPVFSFEISFTQHVQSFNSAWFDALMRFITQIGMSHIDIISVILFSAILILAGKKREGLFLFSTSYGLNLLGLAFKAIVARPRPDPAFFNQIETFTMPNSFPSGHVLYAIGFYGFLFFLTLRLVNPQILKFVLLFICGSVVILMGASRVYVGAHWFTDVTGSYLLGFPWMVLMINLYKRQIKVSTATE